MKIDDQKFKTELRLGNLVRWIDHKEPNVVPWSEGHWLGIQENYSFKDCKPVPLLKKYRNQFPVWFRFILLIKKVKHVHTAQNLYHAITQKELKIKHFV